MNIFYWLSGAIITNIAARVLLALGISIVSYIGLDALIGTVFDGIKSQFLVMDSMVLNLLGLAGVDTALNYIFSAYLARVAISSLVHWRMG